MAKLCIFWIQDGRQSATVDDNITYLGHMIGHAILHLIMKYESSMYIIIQENGKNVEFQDSRWPPVSHFESNFHQYRTCSRLYGHTHYIRI